MLSQEKANCNPLDHQLQQSRATAAAGHSRWGIVWCVRVHTSFTQPAGNLLCLLGRGTGQQGEHLTDTAPARPVQYVCQSHAERSVAAEHVGNVVRKLRHNHTSDNECNNSNTQQTTDVQDMTQSDRFTCTQKMTDNQLNLPHRTKINRQLMKNKKSTADQSGMPLP